jgi:hypothetical protein
MNTIDRLTLIREMPRASIHLWNIAKPAGLVNRTPLPLPELTRTHPRRWRGFRTKAALFRARRNRTPGKWPISLPETFRAHGRRKTRHTEKK